MHTHLDADCHTSTITYLHAHCDQYSLDLDSDCDTSTSTYLDADSDTHLDALTIQACSRLELPSIWWSIALEGE